MQLTFSHCVMIILCHSLSARSKLKNYLLRTAHLRRIKTVSYTNSRWLSVNETPYSPSSPPPPLYPVDLQQVVESMRASLEESAASLLAKTKNVEASKSVIEDTRKQLTEANTKVIIPLHPLWLK